MKVVRLSAVLTGRLYPPRKYYWYSFLLEAESTRGHSAAGRIMSMKNSNDTIGIEPATFWVVVKCLNQVSHRVPLERVKDVLMFRPAWQRRTLPITPSYLFENFKVHGLNS